MSRISTSFSKGIIQTQQNDKSILGKGKRNLKQYQSKKTSLINTFFLALYAELLLIRRGNHLEFQQFSIITGFLMQNVIFKSSEVTRYLSASPYTISQAENPTVSPTGWYLSLHKKQKCYIPSSILYLKL